MNAQDLKNSILQLAVQGQLVEQRPEDGTAKELLKQIKAEKEKLIKEKKIKKEQILPEIAEEEIPFGIPESWKWVRLGDIVSVYGGKRIPAGRTLTEVNTGHKYIRVSDMKDGSVKLEDIKFIEEDIYQKIKAYTISKDDVYITVAGTIGQIGIIPAELDNANLTENADKLILYKADKKFMLYMLSSAMIQEQIKEATTQVGQPKLAIMRIQLLKVVLPPYEEQKRIVAKIEEILPYIEQYDKAHTKLEIFNKKFPEDMKKSILQLAMQGKLVEQRPEEGTADELYGQIAAEKARLIKEGKIKGEKPLPEIGEEEIPFEIPKSWKWMRLKDVCIKIVDGNHNPPRGVDVCTEYIMASSTNINNDEIVELDKVRYLTKEIFEKENERTQVAVGDIFFTSVGTLGRSCVYKGGYNICFQRSVSVIGTLLFNYYLKYVFDSAYFQYKVKREATGTAQKGFYLSQLSAALVPIPPLAEQKRIVAKIEEILPYCEQLMK